jgi:UDP-3-O-[3-hydroxymyristoyl] N-acetylglucosamine deacetylase
MRSRLDAPRRKTAAKSTSPKQASWQTSLARPVALSGRGAHSGAPAHLTLSPAGAGMGVVFCVPGGADVERLIEAHWSRVASAHLRTRLRSGAASVSTIEHLMAALAGLGVDNVLVQLDGLEVPAMDGSALAFVEAIEEAGIVPLAAKRRALRVLQTMRVSDGAAWAEFSPAPAGLHLDVEIAYPGALVGRQRLALALTPESFRRELAPARTFGFLSDAERLWREGLALGASLDNTIVLDGDRALNPQGLRFADEFVRHKMLDVIGDLALAGAPLIGAFRSYRGGHGLNLALVEKLMTMNGAAAWDSDAGADQLKTGANRRLAAIIPPPP